MKTFTVAHVKFVAKANESLHAELGRKAEAAGIPWHRMIEIVDGQVGHTCRVTAHAQLVDMAKNWTADEWQAADKRFA